MFEPTPIGFVGSLLTLSGVARLSLRFFAVVRCRIAARRGAASRSRHRGIRIAAGIVAILLAVVLVVTAPAAQESTVPDDTASLQQRFDGADALPGRHNLGIITAGQNAQLTTCAAGSAQLEDCGPAPELRGITAWQNTFCGSPIVLKSLRGKVILVDFWAYSCADCQRVIPHVAHWYDAYQDSGFEAIGVHTPEYAFERVPANVANRAKALGITYPVALDNRDATSTNYRNRYRPAEYLIDASGRVRHIKFGEGGYASTERLIRRLLQSAHPGVTLPAATEGLSTAVSRPHTAAPADRSSARRAAPRRHRR